MLLHQLEEVCLAPLRHQLARMPFHRGAPGVGLHAAAPPARAARALQLDDHVADLAGAAASRPRLAVEDEPAAHAGSPEDAEQRAVEAPRAEVELGVGGHLHVVADADLGPSALLSLAASGKLPFQPGRLRAPDTVPSLTTPGEPAPTPASAAGSSSAALAASRSDCSIAAATSSGPPSVGVGRRGRAEHGADLVDDDGLDLRAAEVDPAVRRHPG